jgi:hypothetical protein
MRSNQWKIFTTGPFIALVLLSLLSLSVNATITATCPTNPNTNLYNTNYLTNINVCGPLPGQASPIRQYTLNDVTITSKSNGSILSTGKCATGIDNIGTTGYNRSCGPNPTDPGLWACAAGDNRACYKPDGTSSPACTSNQTRDTTLNCVTNTPTITQDCPNGQYKNSSNVCVNQTKCHIENPNGVNPYFDVNTGTCKEPNLPSLVCGSPNTVACEPLNDCIKTTSYCSNSTADKAAHDVLQPTTTSQQKEISQSAASSAAASASAAVTIKSTVDAEVVTKQNAYNSASTAYNNNPSPQTLAPMATALSDFQSATANSTKVGMSSNAAGTASNNANTANNAIDSNNTKQGIAENKATEAQYWKNEAARALAAAGRGTTYIINNYPSPGITGDNEGNDNGSVTDADNDGTPDGIDKNDVDNGQGPNFGDTGTITTSNQALIAALNDYPAIDGVNQIRAMNFGGSGTCPALVLDTGTSWFGSLSTNSHCEIIANHSTLIQNMARVVWVIAALFLFFSA